MAHYSGRHRSIYSLTQSEKNWPVFDSPYNKFWTFSRLLHSKLTLDKHWTKPPLPDSDDGIPLQSSNELLQSGFISDLAFSYDGRFLVAGSTCSDVYIFDPLTTRPETVVRKASPDAITRVCFAGRNKFVLGSANGSLMLWDVRNSKEAVCSLVGHTKVIRSISYDSDKDILATSSSDDQLRYWKLAECAKPAPAQQSGITVSEEESEQPCGILLNCPNISLACMSTTCKKLAFITSNGTLYIIDNLDLDHLKSDLHLFRFDNSIMLQLSWFMPNSALKRRNRLRVIGANDAVPNYPSKIMKVSHVEFHNSQPLLVARISTMRQVPRTMEKNEWTCAYSLQEVSDTAALYYSHECVASFGSDVVQEKLIYSCEEERYNPLREKRLSFSSCGRLIASPSKKCVRLLGFSKELNLPFDWKPKEVKQSSILSFDSLWSSSTDNFSVFSTIDMPENASICTKFSPRDYLLAVGDINDHVYFFRPVL